MLKPLTTGRGRRAAPHLSLEQACHLPVLARPARRGAPPPPVPWHTETRHATRLHKRRSDVAPRAPARLRLAPVAYKEKHE